MAAGYFQNEVDLRATFELFCYKVPDNRSYFIACGLEQIIDYIFNLKFSDEDINFLRTHSAFKNVTSEFFDYLRRFKFSGNLYAMPEGEIFFANEPIIQIEAPIIEAQILETYLLSMTHLQVLVATKASRIVRAASFDGAARGVVDFGSRRAHGPEAAVLAARAAYIGGCMGTSNVWAGKRFGIPIYGTMAHSWVEAFDKEEESFLKYYDVFPQNTILLIDTYDTIKGVQKTAKLGKDIKAVRLDSGNLLTLSKQVRKILDRKNLKKVKIFASGNLNEYKIQKLVKNKAPIDLFGVGTEMVTSRDLPSLDSLDLIYKLVQIEDRDKRVKFKAKLSEGKSTIPGRKQVFRRYTTDGRFVKDIIGLFTEKPLADTQPLLEKVVENGVLIKPLPDIISVRKYVQERIARLPAYCLSLDTSRYLRIEFSKEIKKLKFKL
jgi:nicotinate phosphoribosyltransferase